MSGNDISRRIRNYLQLNKEINIPGIGSFKEHHINQYLSNNETIIHPPYIKVRFEGSTPNQKFNRKFKEYYLDKEVHTYLENHFQEVVNDILNFGEARIKGLGKLRQNDKGDVIFTPSESLSMSSKYLPVIDTLQFKEKGDFTQSKTGTFSSLGKNIPIQSNESERIVDVLHENQIEVKNEVKKNIELKESVDKTINNPTYKSIKKPINNEPNYLLLGSIGVAGLFVLGVFLRQCYFNDPKAQIQDLPDSQLGMINSSKPQNTSEKIYDLTTDSHKSENTIVYTSADNKATIIVGSFKKANNAQRLESRLSYHGWDTTKDIHESGMTRIGVEIEGDEKEINEYLLKIKQDYNKDAWILED